MSATEMMDFGSENNMLKTMCIRKLIRYQSSILVLLVK